ncbi:hypothetical protein [Flavobacterium quisquiliarum]|uniref:Uncharacterized protein n=1 Tax=Flavobacterium quisquiliarum TaxID=1834436 RepID=A0ABV8W3J1_9FLAO|nr:hypothetical protein [Flavobacterium quisquiliarum]MBW1656888.1 hypothetical protein [Flavobacterium quisquiliarum]
MSENKLKHLEFIHNTINRMSTNSFIVKGWTITLISALFVLAQKDSNITYAILTYIAVPIFWYLNAFFLLQERRYRSLYDDVRRKDDNAIDFSMDAKNYNTGKNTIIKCLKANTIWPIYCLMLLIPLGIYLCENSNKYCY